MHRKVPVEIVFILIFLLGFSISACKKNVKSKPVKVGILHSLSGTMAISEKPVVDATVMAIEEINESSGLLGRRIEVVVADGRSDPVTFAQEAERLIVEEKVQVVFGCWTSASRKAVKPVFEKHNHLLFYPVQYEGLESSPNIVYTGAAPNQQIIPAVKWSFDNLGRRFFLVASDYVFPHAANTIIKDQASVLGAEIVGEEYLILGSDDVAGVIRKITEAQPDVILNTINGDSNIAFFRELRKAGITPDKIPTMSFSITENELGYLGIESMAGDHACWTYVQSIESAENKKFVAEFRDRYGSQRAVGDPMEAAYFGVHVWAQTVREAGTTDIDRVRSTLGGQSFQAPQGMVYIDGENNHTWKTVRIGRVQPDGQFRILWTSARPVRPIPYPPYRARTEWAELLQQLYQSWGGAWANPGK